MSQLLKNNIKNCIIFVVIIISLSAISFAKEEKTQVIDGVFSVNVDGRTVNFSEELGEPRILKDTGRTIVPLRVIAEMMGYDVYWGKEPLMAFVSGNDIKIELEIGKNVAVVNGKTVPIETKDGEMVNTKAILIPAKSSSRTYVPLRFVAEMMEARVDYKNIDGIHCISIYTKGFKAPKLKNNDNKVSSRNILCYSSYIKMMKEA